MDERVMQFRVGVTVLATLIITAILVLIFGQMSMFTGGSYTIHLRLREVFVRRPARVRQRELR